MKKTLLQLIFLICFLAVQGFAQTFPWISSITPASGSGSSVSLSTVGYFSDPTQNSLYIWVKIGDQAHGCNVLFELRSNSIYLLSDDGGNWGSASPNGSAGSKGNSQCSFPLSSVTQTTFGNTRTVTFVPTYTAAFGGPHAQSAQAYALDGTISAWFTSGTWTVPGGSGGPPTITSISPTSSSSTTTHYTVISNDAAGAADIQYNSLSVGPFWGPNGCTVVMYRSGGILLMNDAGNNWITAAPYQNSQCLVTGDAPSLNGNNLTTGTTITALGSFSGSKAIGGQVVNNANQYTQAFNLGNWTIPTMQEQIIAYVKESPATLNPGEVNMSRITLSQAGQDLDTMALRVYHGNDPVTFRVRYARPNSQVWVTRIATVPAGAPSAGTAHVHTVCGPDNGNQNQGIQQAILDPVNGDNYGACYLGMTDSSGYLEWTGRIWYSTAPQTYQQYISGMISAQFYIGPQVFNPNFPGITNGPMNEDNYVGALVYWVIGTDGYQGPAPY